MNYQENLNQRNGDGTSRQLPSTFPLPFSLLPRSVFIVFVPTGEVNSPDAFATPMTSETAHMTAVLVPTPVTPLPKPIFLPWHKIYPLEASVQAEIQAVLESLVPPSTSLSSSLVPMPPTQPTIFPQMPPLGLNAQPIQYNRQLSSSTPVISSPIRMPMGPWYYQRDQRPISPVELPNNFPSAPVNPPTQFPMTPPVQQPNGVPFSAQYRVPTQISMPPQNQPLNQTSTRPYHSTEAQSYSSLLPATTTRTIEKRGVTIKFIGYGRDSDGRIYPVYEENDNHEVLIHQTQMVSPNHIEEETSIQERQNLQNNMIPENSFENPPRFDNHQVYPTRQGERNDDTEIEEPRDLQQSFEEFVPADNAVTLKDSSDFESDSTQVQENAADNDLSCLAARNEHEGADDVQLKTTQSEKKHGEMNKETNVDQSRETTEQKIDPILLQDDVQHDEAEVNAQDLSVEMKGVDPSIDNDDSDSVDMSREMMKSLLKKPVKKVKKRKFPTTSEKKSCRRRLFDTNAYESPFEELTPETVPMNNLETKKNEADAVAELEMEPEITVVVKSMRKVKKQLKKREKKKEKKIAARLAREEMTKQSLDVTISHHQEEKQFTNLVSDLTVNEKMLCWEETVKYLEKLEDRSIRNFEFTPNPIIENADYTPDETDHFLQLILKYYFSKNGVLVPSRDYTILTKDRYDCFVANFNQYLLDRMAGGTEDHLADVLTSLKRKIRSSLQMAKVILYLARSYKEKTYEQFERSVLFLFLGKLVSQEAKEKKVEISINVEDHCRKNGLGVELKYRLAQQFCSKRIEHFQRAGESGQEMRKVYAEVEKVLNLPELVFLWTEILLGGLQVLTKNQRFIEAEYWKEIIHYIE